MRTRANRHVQSLKAMTYEDLKGKKVLVTGASSGIGLASEAASFITGEYIAVNGGLLMRA